MTKIKGYISDSRLLYLGPPLLFAIYAVLALLASNIYELQWTEVFRPLGLSIMGICVALLIIHLIVRDPRKTSLITTLLVFLFFTYGHVYQEVKNIELMGILVGRHRFLILVWLGLLVVGLLLIFKLKPSEDRIFSFLIIVSCAALVFPIFTIGRYAYQRWQIGAGTDYDNLTPQLRYPSGEIPPDIYYILLDSYAREDILLDIYGFDNSAFTTALKDRGFYVADQSNTNHVSTSFSLASSLNMNYIQDMGLNLIPGSYPLPLRDPIRKSKVRQNLENLGYRTVALASGLIPTTIIDADVFLSPVTDTTSNRFGILSSAISPFERLLLQTTLLSMPLDYLSGEATRSAASWAADHSGAAYYRELVLSSFEHLGEVNELTGPNFIFAHIISPHRPYVFGQEGESTASNAYSFSDTGSGAEVEEEFYKYRDQLIYVNQRVLEVVDAIIKESSTPPIIIIQADHGPAFSLDWDAPDQRNLKTKIAILNAYYLPEDCDQDLYPTVSPVNTFRIIFNCVFDGNYRILNDQTYFSNHHSQDGYEFTAIEEMLE